MSDQPSSAGVGSVPVGDGPGEEALELLYEQHKNQSDKPGVRVWYPTSMPYAHLQTRTVGLHTPEQHEELHEGPPMANFYLGGVEFGGPLDLLELQYAALGEELARVRQWADQLLAEREARKAAAS